MTVLDMLRSLSPHMMRTPSLTDTDDSAPSEELPEPATITNITTTTKDSLLMRSSSKTMSKVSLVSHPTSRVRSNSRSSTIMMMFQRPLVVALSEPRIVGVLIRYLNWHDFRMLAMTSRSVRSALEAEECMDSVLARFIPGYGLGVRPEEQIHVSIDHLESFMLSQHMSVHLYPTHALSVVDSLMNAMHLASHTTERFQELTSAHSRIVLLLRSRALAAPNAPEIDEPSSPPLPSAPQLVFPAPLFAAPAQSRPPAKKEEKERRRSSITSLFTLSRGSSKRKRMPPPPPPIMKTHRSSIYQSLEKRSSIYSTVGPNFSNSSQQFASTRRSSRSSRPARSKSTPPVHPRPGDDDTLSLKPPRPWYKRHSSLPGTPASSSRGSLTAVSESIREHAPNAPLLPTGPHDLLYASVPGRAPILRVFVPTDVLSPESIRACEALLLRAGLWDNMKAGDIVCNLGYVPRASIPGSPVDQFGRLSNPSDARQTEWLIFTGHALVSYVPPAPPPPDINILSLPGPAYYSHLYNPTPTQLVLPECEPGPAVCGSVYAFSVPRRSTEPTFTLDSSVSYVKSSRGVARVWRPVWIASFRVDPVFRGGSRKGKHRADSVLSEAWSGEWVLEGMGTREGERALLNAMDDGQVRFWEWVREKSTPGRHWFRLVDAPVLGVTEVVPPVPPIPAHHLPVQITDTPVTEEPRGSSIEDDTTATTAHTTPASTVAKHES
ncbi:hypothetical protein RSOLAG22IIIB_05431 [Rhizoctonia solani]|uniref:Uncharacterized protein n=1 Tax=Rhizoctonia solani TaxID=456999 RepID=A0A0K6G6N6_9AGAM|nr:hypothetical protein RSOLAG22IIIB_05431 [Rhizoctonia solani]